MIVPLEHDASTTPTRRCAAHPALAIARDSLLPITPPSLGSDPFGLHPSLPELQTLWNEQKLAGVCNVGPLVQPLTTRGVSRRRAAPVPAVLALRSDGAVADGDRRIASARPAGAAARPTLRPCHAIAVFPMITSLSGGHLHARPDAPHRCRSRRADARSTRCWC